MKRVQKRQKYRVTAAYVLLLTLMPLFLVKAFHVHKESECISHSGQRTHDSEDNCAICLFALSAFTEAENFEFHYLTPGIPVERPVREEKGVMAPFLFQFLRAPPFMILQ